MRLAAFCAYLGAWVVFAIGAIAGGIPRVQRLAGAGFTLAGSVVIGTLLQIGSVLVITWRLSDKPLAPTRLELIGVLALAPLGAALFVWALLSGRGKAGLVTWGPYSWMRHPIYLAFFAMLLATGLLASAGLRLAVAVVIYLAGTEMRIASEEAELAAAFPTEYGQYRVRTRWRYLPGLR
jgi:protein-S-isoprenylcysteine O-methyltransferase Ste14